MGNKKKKKKAPPGVLEGEGTAEVDAAQGKSPNSVLGGLSASVHKDVKR